MGEVAERNACLDFLKMRGVIEDYQVNPSWAQEYIVQPNKCQDFILMNEKQIQLLNDTLKCMGVILYAKPS